MRLLVCLLAIALSHAGQEPGAGRQAARPDFYDEQADAGAQVAGARAAAAAGNRRVLIVWGADWCGPCHLLHDALAGDAAVSRKLLYEYEVVPVDVGEWNRNMDLAAGFGADLNRHGIPYLTVLDAEGRVLANQETRAFKGFIKGKYRDDPEKVLAFLSRHQAPYPHAERVLREALAKAGEDGRKVLVHFGAPACEPCSRFEAWLGLEIVADTLARDFVVARIDAKRTIGGEELLLDMAGGVAAELPWIVLLEAGGEANAGGAMGLPRTDEEVAAFRTMLARAAAVITPGDLDRITAALVEEPARPADPAGQ